MSGLDSYFILILVTVTLSARIPQVPLDKHERDGRGVPDGIATYIVSLMLTLFLSPRQCSGAMRWTTRKARSALYVKVPTSWPESPDKLEDRSAT